TSGPSGASGAIGPSGASGAIGPSGAIDPSGASGASGPVEPAEEPAAQVEPAEELAARVEPVEPAAPVEEPKEPAESVEEPAKEQAAPVEPAASSGTSWWEGQSAVDDAAEAAEVRRRPREIESRRFSKKSTGMAMPFLMEVLQAVVGLVRRQEETQALLQRSLEAAAVKKKKEKKKARVEAPEHQSRMTTMTNQIAVPEMLWALLIRR
ncbi:unnamed protein product, partial [Symbiodinium sp. CCMP2456]